MVQYHQIRLQQLYQESQCIMMNQQFQQKYPLTIEQQQIHHALQQCIKKMQCHYLEILHLQYPSCSFSFPYLPTHDSTHLSYRHLTVHDENMDDENGIDNQRNRYTEDECDTTTSNSRCCTDDCDEFQRSNDDRLTIETSFGLVEYCSKCCEWKEIEYITQYFI